MIIFDIITIFPEIFNDFLKQSLIKKAQDKNLIAVNLHNLRKWALDKHQNVDDKPFGGGRGMVVKVEPVFRAVSSLVKIKNPKFLSLEFSKKIWKNEKSKITPQKSKIILFSPRGKKFDQKLAYQFSKLDQLIMICGRYEAVDERVAKYIADIELSVGDYVLMGGELPAMIVIEAVSRLIPKVLQKSELLSERMPKAKGRTGRSFIEYPQYTRPALFEPDKIILSKKIRKTQTCFFKHKKSKVWRVPKILLSGDHQKIKEWREKHKKIIEK